MEDEKREPLGPPVIAFVCDRKQCENCSYPICRHTLDIEHAVNFERFPGTMQYFEKEETEC